jgi:Putative peptidoglycan binding domain
MARRRVVTAGILSLGLVTATGGVVWWSTRPVQNSTTTTVGVATAPVIRTNLATTTQLSGTLGYAQTYRIDAQGTGTITALPQPGQVVSRGHRLYELDGSPVYVFYGARPSWRPLADGSPPGADVRQLEENLTALGYADSVTLTVDDTFDWATDLAIRRWQTATGQPVTGELPLGQVVYEPGPVQVLGTVTNLGALIAPGTSVLQASSTTPAITMPVPAAQTYLVHPGDAVTVTLPSARLPPAGSGQSRLSRAQAQQTTPLTRGRPEVPRMRPDRRRCPPRWLSIIRRSRPTWTRPR